MKLRHALLAAAGSTALLVGGLAVPAQAAPQVTVTFTVVDTNDEPLRNIEIEIESDDDYFELGSTGANGQLTVSTDVDDDPIVPGDYEVYAYDYDDARGQAGTIKADYFADITLVAGQNDIGITMEEGGSISGKITAPSGRAVKNVGVLAWTKIPDLNFWFPVPFAGISKSDGTYRAFGLSDGRYGVKATVVPVNQETAYEVDTYSTSAPGLNLGVSEQKTGVNITNWKVRCSTIGFNVASSKSGQVDLAVRATAPYSGLTNPGGTITITRGSAVVTTIKVTGATQKVSVPGQPKGKKTGYTATYRQGDCLNWTVAKSVTIKK